MFNRVFIAVIAIFLIASGIIYYVLGGFNSPEISIEDKSSVILYGAAYEGRYRSDEAEELFYKVRSEQQTIAGSQFVIVSFPTETEDQVSYFIGLNTDSDPGVEGLRERELQGFTKIIRFKWNKHNLVMPKPFKVKQMAEKMASDNDMELLGYTIETYLSERELQIDFPAK